MVDKIEPLKDPKWKSKEFAEYMNKAREDVLKKYLVSDDEFSKAQGVLTDEQLKKDLGEIYEEIIKVLSRFLDLKKEYYNLLAVWAIGTYIYQEFETFPYLFFNAMRGSGKTRMLKLLASICNNGELVGNLSEAVLFRTAKNRTMCIDEFERVQSKEKQTLRELLNAAYKRGQVIKRMKKKGEEFIVDEFEVYTPIAMANIWGMEEVLADRCLSLVLEKSNKSSVVKLIENFSQNPQILEIKQRLSQIQCSLCSVVVKKDMGKWWNNYILDKYENSLTTLTTLTTFPTQTTQTTQNNTHNPFISVFNKIDKSGISGRHLELAFPLLMLADFINIFDKILPVMSEIIQEKKLEDIAESKDVQVYDFVSQQEETDFRLVSEITEAFRYFLNISEKEDVWINSRWLGKALKRLVLIKEKKRVGRGVSVILNIEKAKEKIKMFK